MCFAKTCKPAKAQHAKLLLQFPIPAVESSAFTYIPAPYHGLRGFYPARPSSCLSPQACSQCSAQTLLSLPQAGQVLPPSGLCSRGPPFTSAPLRGRLLLNVQAQPVSHLLLNDLCDHGMPRCATLWPPSNATPLVTTSSGLIFFLPLITLNRVKSNPILV